MEFISGRNETKWRRNEDFKVVCSPTRCSLFSFLLLLSPERSAALQTEFKLQITMQARNCHAKFCVTLYLKVISPPFRFVSARNEFHFGVSFRFVSERNSVRNEESETYINTLRNEKSYINTRAGKVATSFRE